MVQGSAPLKCKHFQDPKVVHSPNKITFSQNGDILETRYLLSQETIIDK